MASLPFLQMSMRLPRVREAHGLGIGALTCRFEATFAERRSSLLFGSSTPMPCICE